MTNAMPSWSWQGYEGNPAVVEVYTQAYEAELFLNGRSVGRKKRGKDCRLLFHCTYDNGTLSVKTYDEGGKQEGYAQLTTAGQETCLCAEPEQGQVLPGGLSFIRLRYTDEQGVLKPLERHRISVAVTGGRLLGLGHACPYNPDGYLGKDTDTYWGEALAAVQAGDAGKVVLTAEDGERMVRAEVEIL
jgi:beta-galactosidase